MSTTGLSHAEALAKLSQVDDFMNQARQGVQKMQDSTTQMTSSSWLGNQSQLFGQRMQQHTDDMTAVVNQLAHYVETGRSNINALVNLEAE
jgi:uncharacterized protein YukE